VIYIIFEREFYEEIKSTENYLLFSTVKRRAMEIKVLEKLYPGISRQKKNAEGAFVVPFIPEEELSRIIETLCFSG
jgi:hypothetical protein